jgi:hypothetical protein
VFPRHGGELEFNVEGWHALLNILVSLLLLLLNGIVRFCRHSPRSSKFLFQIAFSFCTRGKNNGLLAVGHQPTSFRLGNMTDERQMVPQGGRCSDLTNDTNLLFVLFTRVAVFVFDLALKSF